MNAIRHPERLWAIIVLIAVVLVASLYHRQIRIRYHQFALQRIVEKGRLLSAGGKIAPSYWQKMLRHEGELLNLGYLETRDFTFAAANMKDPSTYRAFRDHITRTFGDGSWWSFSAKGSNTISITAPAGAWPEWAKAVSAFGQDRGNSHVKSH
jgi:hypothetical protein